MGMSFHLVSFIFFLAFIVARSRATNGESENSPSRDLFDPREQRRDLWRTETRIVGGHDAISGDFPNFVELSNGCGGALIHNDLVLTAGTLNKPLFF